MIMFWKILASHDNVDDFNEDTCEVCLYDVHSTENKVEVQELFEDDRKLNLKMLLRTRLRILMRILVICAHMIF